jgi:hypothetical protein
MPSRSSHTNRALTSIAGPVAHPERYHKQFWMAGTFVVLAAVVYFLIGLLALVVLLVIGGVATRYAIRNGRSFRQIRS